MDRKTLAGVALCVLFLIFYRPILHVVGWDKYLPAGQAVTTARRDTTRATGGDTAASGSNATIGGSPQAAAGGSGGTLSGAVAPAAAPKQPVAAGGTPSPGSLFTTPTQPPPSELEQTFELETKLYRATFTNRGARLLAVQLKHYASANGPGSRNGMAVRVRAGQDIPVDDQVTLSGGPLFRIDLGSGDLRRDLSNVVFAVRESLDASGGRRALTFTATDSSGAFVRQTYRTRPDSYAIDLETELRGIPTGWRLPDYSLTVRSWPLLTEADEIADARSLRATSLVGTNFHHELAPRLVGKPKQFEGSAAWAAVQSRYFVAVIATAQGSGRSVLSSAVRRDILPAEKAALPPGAHPQMEVADNTLVVGLPSELAPTQRFVLYVGPSEFFGLNPLKLNFDRLVDLGWTWIRPFSRALLWLLKWLYGVVRNYGFAIILLATLVRLLLHPLNVAGLKSMRAMQRIQPELERLRAKYKDDAQALNTAMMALYKENKVNPAGGCLPTLVQVPVFFALYSVLFNSIELRQAPFIGWIHDLSAPDLLFTVASFPIRLLPLLMLGSGLLSQKFTPSDPRQLPTMYMMNAFMTVFFYNLPSGLVLYWTLMNVLTAVQQWLVLREHGASTVVVVPAGPTPGKSRKRGSV
jgi:YidC/Oxa1 family membrane protein insertase